MSQDLPLSAQPLPATLGGIPTKTVDIPICAVLLGCYLGMAVTHMTIFRHNCANGRTFRPSVLCFAFCIARLVTFTMRIVWAVEPNNHNVAIASNVLIAAGVILLWFLNRIFATRLFGEYHPHTYRRTFVRLLLRRLPYALVLCCLPLVIVALVQKFKSRNPNILHIDSIIFKTALALFVAFTFSPFLVLLFTLLIPGRKSENEVRAMQDRLSTGHTPKKVAVIAVATSLLLWELAIRVAAALQTFPMASAPWYYSKPAFYIFLPGFELIVLGMYAVTRVDRMFYALGRHEQLPSAPREEYEMN